MPKRSLLLKLTSLITFVLFASQLFGADPAPANPPSNGDPAPASPPISGDPAPAGSPTSFDSDPAPASPPVSMTSDPAPASPPGTSSSPELLIDMPRSAADAPAPAGAPGSPPTDFPSGISSSAATPSRKPFLGVGFRDPSNTTVTTLWANSTAAKLGIQLGDSIVSINGSNVSNLQQIRDLLSRMNVGNEATVMIMRKQSGRLSVGPMPLGASYE